MVTIERLHPSEFDLLKKVDDGFCPDPGKSIALVGRSGGKIVSRLCLVAPAHVEAIFIEPAWRGGSVFKDMMDAMEIEARAEGINTLFAYAINEGIERYISRRCGYVKMPLSVWGKGI